jgi:uncharacterized membrane protein
VFEELFLIVGKSIAMIGVVVIVYSASKSVYLFVQGLMGTSVDINRIRLEFGYGIILGLEFLVAADIIESIGKPTYYDIGILASIVLIRTFLSYFLNKELEQLSPEGKETLKDVSKA